MTATAATSSPKAGACAGFTMMELVIVIILLGVLAVAALPKLSGNSIFRAAAFHDEIVAALRYAQKSAVSHRRLVCATFTPTSVTLTIALNDSDTACSATTLNSPTGDAAYARSLDADNVTVDLSPSGPIYFRPAGTATADGAGSNPTDYTVTVNDSGSVSASITVVGATGYVQ